MDASPIATVVKLFQHFVQPLKLLDVAHHTVLGEEHIEFAARQTCKCVGNGEGHDSRFTRTQQKGNCFLRDFRK
jgi:hypothetical protein